MRFSGVSVSRAAKLWLFGRDREYDMTKTEFIERCKAASQRGRLGNAPLEREGCLVLAAALGTTVIAFAAAALAAHLLFEVKWTLFVLVFMVSSSLCSTWVEKLYRQRQWRKAGLVCPTCSTLLQENLAYIAIATGNCGSCGQPVLDDRGTKTRWEAEPVVVSQPGVNPIK